MLKVLSKIRIAEKSMPVQNNYLFPRDGCGSVYNFNWKIVCTLNTYFLS